MDMKKSRTVYLDNAATTPVDPGVLKVMLPYLQGDYGNASSLHKLGLSAKRAISDSRKKIADIMKVTPDEMVFTSGGTESDNLAILGLARANKSKGKHIIVSNIEHKAVLDSVRQLDREGFEITYLPVDKNGLISLSALKTSIKPETILVSIMYANNEIGTIEPITKIAKIIKEFKGSQIIFHTDACQAVGALPINIKKLGVDALTISASKIYGPKGIGCLYVNKNVKIEPILYGGGQERGIRSGTENVAGIVGLTQAIQIAEEKREKEYVRLEKLRNYFLIEILKKISGVSLNSGLKNRLPNNINISITGVEGEALVLLLDHYGIYSSTGSACSTVDIKASYVLVNIGIKIEQAHCSVRFSLGRHTSKADIDYTVDKLALSVAKIRSMSTVK